MSFHVEVGRSFRRARVFNLDEAQLRATILEPWVHGRPVELGDREWDPRDFDITVLEGPDLNTSELAHGQGWNSATKSSRDVTAQVLAALAAAPQPGTSVAPTAVAVVAGNQGAATALRALVEDLGLSPVDWDVLRATLLAYAAVVGAGPAAAGPGAAAAVVLAGDDAAGQRAFDAGLAIGALGGRAIVVRLGAEPAGAEFAGVPVIRLDEGAPALHALAERLRLAGCAVRPVPGWDSPARFADV